MPGEAPAKPKLPDLPAMPALPALDVEAALREAQHVLQQLDALGQQLDALRQQAHGALEAEARKLVEQAVEPEKREQAWAVAQHGLRIAEEVSAWTFERTLPGLAAKLWPEVRAGLADLQRFLEPAPRPAGGHGNGASSGSGAKR
jgi:plasmid stability protein